MTIRSLALAGVLVTAAVSLSACGGGDSAASQTTVATTAAAAPAQGSAAEATTPAAGSATTSNGVAVGEPHPSNMAPSTLTKQDAGVPGASGAKGATMQEFCGDLKVAQWSPKDMGDLPTGADIKVTTEAVVDRLQRLGPVRPPAELAQDWRTALESFDTVASKVQGANKPAAVPGIVKAGLAESKAARDHVLEVAKPCR
ncbi:hypothetical protein [Arsenicicoccus dermatophilus]|uniref:hypothetical protein n=1 Tax=Arsenicicoccus dermatophilus TaxID=1076331 RepID=UPI001F4C5946|nr:hypothetical protein [Arsenicicoccus dermatophilus]MCH8613938.1 hypothetical protein [Arsenicicoccus dermatophilus]